MSQQPRCHRCGRFVSKSTRTCVNCPVASKALLPVNYDFDFDLGVSSARCRKAPISVLSSTPIQSTTVVVGRTPSPPPMSSRLRFNDLLSEVNSLQSQYKKIDPLTSAVDALEDSQRSLLDKYSDLETRSRSLDRSNSDTVAMLIDVRNLLQTIVKNITTVEVKINTEIKTVNDRIKTFYAKVEDIDLRTQRIDYLISQVNNLESTTASLTCTADALKTGQHSLLAEFSDLKTLTFSSNQLNSDNATMLSDLHSLLKTTDENITAVEVKIDTGIKAVNNRMDAFCTKIEDIDSCTQHIDDLISQVDTLESTITSLTSAVDAVETGQHSLFAKFSDLTTRTLLSNRINADTAAMTIDLRSLLQTCSNNIITLENKIDAITDRMNIESLHTDVGTARMGTFYDKVDDIDTRTQRIDDLISQVNTLQSTIAHMTSGVDILEIGQRSLLTKYSDLANQYNLLEERLSSSQSSRPTNSLHNNIFAARLDKIEHRQRNRELMIFSLSVIIIIIVISIIK